MFNFTAANLAFYTICKSGIADPELFDPYLMRGGGGGGRRPGNLKTFHFELSFSKKPADLKSVPRTAGNIENGTVLKEAIVRTME
jgi:hypothetical protein